MSYKCCGEIQKEYPCEMCYQYRDKRTKWYDSHGQYCPGCIDISLITISDWVGGGSHYWDLICPKCQTKYSYDTYRFEVYDICLPPKGVTND